ncbi:MAG: carotenoid oxygenase family protein [Kofleriaceae bacterium]
MHHAASENASASGFRSATEVPVPTELMVVGELPPWLTGRMVHTGPALYDLPRGRYAHWFDGLALLGSIEIVNGRVMYCSRFLDSEAYLLAREAGKPVLGEFGTKPPRGRIDELLAHLLPPNPTDNANVNIVDIGGRTIAMTESSRHIEFDPATLQTRGEIDYDDELDGQLSTAHPHTDVDAGELYNLLIRFGRTSAVQVYAQQLGTIRRRLIASIETTRPSYFHSFAMTEHFIVLTENPLVVNPLKLRFSTRPYIDRYDWRPELGTRVLLVRKEDGQIRASATAPPLFVFHHVNAVERGHAVDIDVVAYPDPSIVRRLTLDTLRYGPTSTTGQLLRLTMRSDQLDQRIIGDELVPERLELPRIHPRCERRAYRYLYAASSVEPGGYFDRILKIDLDNRMMRAFGRDGWYFDEPLPVPAPGGLAEDDGVVLSTVFDARTQRGKLVVLDARSLDLIALADLPQIVPFYFHGQWLPAAASSTV